MHTVNVTKVFCISLLFCGVLSVLTADDNRKVPLPKTLLPIIPSIILVQVTPRTTMAEVNIQIKKQCTIAKNITLNRNGTVLKNNEPCGQFLLEFYSNNGTIPVMMAVKSAPRCISHVIIEKRQVTWTKRKLDRRKST